MFGRRLPLGPLSDWCRSLANSLKSGRTLVESLRSQADKGPLPIRPTSRELVERLESGEDVAAAFHATGTRFPRLFLSMIDVADRTGHLPEILRTLESYFRLQVSLRRKLIAQITWPVFQLVIAIFVIALVIFILGMIADIQGEKNTIDLFGLGLRGPGGAVIWLTACFGSFALAYLAYWAAREYFDKNHWIDKALLRVPVLGRSLELLALTRLCIAMKMTLDSGMSVHEAMSLSLLATDNGAYRALEPNVVRSIRGGESLFDSLSAEGIFPSEFLESLATAEESGEVPEVMDRQAEAYRELAELQLGVLNTAIGWGVWLLVAGMIIFFIFRFFLAYVKIINSLM